jgi:acetyltransferase-like isoleucine patch superfamily enzyme
MITKLMNRFRGIFLAFFGKPHFQSIGKLNKIIGKNIKVEQGVSIGDFNWIQTVHKYGDEKFDSIILIGKNTKISDFVHISAVDSIRIGNDCLLGSKIYIGDHSHGDTKNLQEINNVAPSKRKLSNIESIEIGDNTWICDNAVILAGSSIHKCSIISANSVVKIKTNRPALIAGIPAKIIRYLDE